MKIVPCNQPNLVAYLPAPYSASSTCLLIKRPPTTLQVPQVNDLVFGVLASWQISVCRSSTISQWQTSPVRRSVANPRVPCPRRIRIKIGSTRIMTSKSEPAMSHTCLFRWVEFFLSSQHSRATKATDKYSMNLTDTATSCMDTTLSTKATTSPVSHMIQTHQESHLGMRGLLWI
jgi:hypothetical protein